MGLVADVKALSRMPAQVRHGIGARDDGLHFIHTCRGPRLHARGCHFGECCAQHVVLQAHGRHGTRNPDTNFRRHPDIHAAGQTRRGRTAGAEKQPTDDQNRKVGPGEFRESRHFVVS